MNRKDWGFKQKESEVGGQYTFLSVDVKSRLIINSVTGPRSSEIATDFFAELKKRVPTRFQLNTDAWTGYAGTRGHKNVTLEIFGKEIDHATEEKEFYKLNQFVTRSLAKTKRKAASAILI